MDETFSSIDLVTQCLTDKRRTLKFQEAINRSIKPGDVVLDSGTGSGILALMAARAGAKKVIAVEFDPFIAQLAAKNFAQNGYAGVIDIVVGDVRNANFPSNTVFDVVIMEMLTTGMIDEFQIWAINNLHKKGYVGPQTRFIPQRQDSYVALANADFETYGFDMRMVRHQWEPHAVVDVEYASNAQLLNSIHFDKENPLVFESTLSIPVQKDLTINSICITSTSILDEAIQVGDTAALNAPVIVPINEDIEVRKGDTVELAITYQFGGGFRNLSVNVQKL